MSLLHMSPGLPTMYRLLVTHAATSLLGAIKRTVQR